MRPRVIVNCAVSVDGCLDDATPRRLLLSGPEDFDRVDAERAGSDAVMVGAGTLAADDPRLLVRSEHRQAERVARGEPGQPVRVVLAASGRVEAGARLFSTGPDGDAGRLVYVSSPHREQVGARLAGRAVVVDAGDPLSLERVLADLRTRGVRRLMVEGGAAVVAALLRADLVDRLQLYVASILVGDASAPRFAAPGPFPQGSRTPMRLDAVRRLGDGVLMSYVIGGHE